MKGRGAHAWEPLHSYTYLRVTLPLAETLSRCLTPNPVKNYPGDRALSDPLSLEWIGSGVHHLRPGVRRVTGVVTRSRGMTSETQSTCSALSAEITAVMEDYA
jgi:hypothetical protein